MERRRKKIDAVPLSDNTVNRRISDMAEDVEQVRASEYFALQLNESTDVANATELLVHIIVQKKRLNVEPQGERFFWTTTLDQMDLTGLVVWECLDDREEQWNDLFSHTACSTVKRLWLNGSRMSLIRCYRT